MMKTTSQHNPLFIDAQLNDLMLYQSSDQADIVLIHAEIDRIYELIVHALRDSANLTIPRLKTNALKYWWDQEMNEIKMNSVTSFCALQAAGKPRSGTIHHEMLVHKMRYRKAIKDKSNQNLFLVSNDLHDFW